MKTTNQTIHNQIEQVSIELQNLKKGANQVNEEWAKYVNDYELTPTLNHLLHLRQFIRSNIEFIEDIMYGLKQEADTLAILYKQRSKEYSGKK
tara:strand:- start:2138 stop:2416 length:279 start_codon:yes stop_codon:yes gene_type:complete